MGGPTLLDNIHYIVADLGTNPVFLTEIAALIAGYGVGWWRGRDPVLGAFKWGVAVAVVFQAFLAVVLFALLIVQTE
jgi:hypothetical protein